MGKREKEVETGRRKVEEKEKEKEKEKVESKVQKEEEILGKIEIEIKRGKKTRRKLLILNVILCDQISLSYNINPSLTPRDKVKV